MTKPSSLRCYKISRSGEDYWGDRASWGVRLVDGTRIGVYLHYHTGLGWGLNYSEILHPWGKQIVTLMGPGSYFPTRREMLENIQGVLLSLGEL